MTRLPIVFFAGAMLLPGCAAPPAPPSARAPFFFAKQIDAAEQDFDRNLFLSYRKDGLLAAPVTMDDETRLSLSPPVPSRLTFAVNVPHQPVFRFAIGVSGLGEEVLSRPVAFTVHVESDGHEEVVFEETVRRGQSNTWFDRSADLTPWSGESIRLVFDTSLVGENTAEAGGTLLPAWGRPVLDDARASPERTNIVLISIDCLRADHVGAYGYYRNTTPSIDALAADGVVFENAMSVSSWTLPTHMSMLTGLMPSFHGVDRSHKLSASVPFLPEMLLQAGYETLGVTSGAYLSQAFGFERGFDIYRLLNDSRAEQVVDAALDLTRQARTRDHFLFLHLFDAHWPYVPPRSFLDRFDERPTDISDIMPKIIYRKPPTGPEEIQEFVNLYDGEIAYLDRELGRFFDGLKEQSLYDRTLIMLTADHGESFWERELWQHSESIYQEVLHVPLIVKWPVKWPAAARTGRSPRLVSHLSILPTIVDQAGLESPYHEYSSLDRYFDGIDQPTRVMSEITWEPKPTSGASMKVALMEGDLKYIVTMKGDIGDEEFVSEVVQEELYDLSKDPGERTNLLSGAARDLGNLRAEVRQFIDQARILRAERRGQEIVLDEALEEQLRALGYIN
jgi:arylsulfatase A-like enzyme